MPTRGPVESVNIHNLQPSTEYVLKIRAVGVGGDVSTWTRTNFRTRPAATQAPRTTTLRTTTTPRPTTTTTVRTTTEFVSGFTRIAPEDTSVLVSFSGPIRDVNRFILSLTTPSRVVFVSFATALFFFRV